VNSGYKTTKILNLISKFSLINFGTLAELQTSLRYLISLTTMPWNVWRQFKGRPGIIFSIQDILVKITLAKRSSTFVLWITYKRNLFQEYLGWCLDLMIKLFCYFVLYRFLSMKRPIVTAKKRSFFLWDNELLERNFGWHF